MILAYSVNVPVDYLAEQERDILVRVAASALKHRSSTIIIYTLQTSEHVT